MRRRNRSAHALKLLSLSIHMPISMRVFIHLLCTLHPHRTKITSELRHLEEGFHSKLEALAATRSSVDRIITAIELYGARLKLAVQARRDVSVQNRELEQAWLELIPHEERAANAHEEFKALLDVQVGHGSVGYVRRELMCLHVNIKHCSAYAGVCVLDSVDPL